MVAMGSSWSVPDVTNVYHEAVKAETLRFLTALNNGIQNFVVSDDVLICAHVNGLFDMSPFVKHNKAQFDRLVDEFKACYGNKSNHDSKGDQEDDPN